MSEKDIPKEIPWRIGILLVILLLLTTIGTIGFKFLLNKSFTEAFGITLETFAFVFYTGAGPARVLSIMLAVFGVIILWWALWSIFDLIFEGNITEYLKMHKVLSRMNKMKNHYIIAGGGRVGEEIAKSLAKAKKDVILIEKDEPTTIKLRKLGFLAIHGDVTDEKVLREANIMNAKSIILAMPETEKNLLVTMSVREINLNIEIYARADKPAFVSKLLKAGAKKVIVPELAAAEKFIEALN
jgi:voltage-gated potassium channel